MLNSFSVGDADLRMRAAVAGSVLEMRKKIVEFILCRVRERFGVVEDGGKRNKTKTNSFSFGGWRGNGVVADREKNQFILLWESG